MENSVYYVASPEACAAILCLLIVNDRHRWVQHDDILALLAVWIGIHPRRATRSQALAPSLGRTFSVITHRPCLLFVPV